MLQDQEKCEDSSEGHEEDLNIGFSWLNSSSILEPSAEVESEENYSWDSYREVPSFVDPHSTLLPVEEGLEEVDDGLPRQSTPRRKQSSTDIQFLDKEDSPVQTLQPFVFEENSDKPYSVWPPRNPSSDSEVWIEENFLPAGLLDTVEEEADEVFDISEVIGRKLEITRMPPKPSPTPVQIHDSFMEKLDDWDEMKAWAEDLGADVGTDTLK